MKVSTLILSDGALDWAVATAAGRSGAYMMNDSHYGNYSPSTRWAQAGALIEQNNIRVGPSGNSPYSNEPYVAEVVGPNGAAHQIAFGASHLEAAMRTFVLLKLGTEVDIPGHVFQDSQKQEVSASRARKF